MPKNRGRQLEDQVIKMLGARPHKNSGALAEKFDANTKYNVIEIKSTQAGSFKLDKSYWNMLYEDSIKHGKEPALVIIWDNKNHVDQNDMCVIIPMGSFMFLQECENM